MNEISDRLQSAEAAPPGFDSSTVRSRVQTRRQRKRRRRAAAALGVAAAIAAGAIAFSGDDDPDVEVVDPVTTTSLSDGAADGDDPLVSNLWRMVSADGRPYEELADGWGGSSAGRVARPSMQFDAGGFARVDTGCLVVQFGWQADVDGAVVLSRTSSPSRSCGPLADEVSDLVLSELGDMADARLGSGELQIGGLVFAASEPIDVGAVDGWELAFVDDDPAVISAWIALPTRAGEDWHLDIANCDGGRGYQLFLDTTGDDIIGAVAGGSDFLCGDGTAPDRAQVDVVDEVLAGLPVVLIDASVLSLQTDAHTLRFMAPTADQAFPNAPVPLRFGERDTTTYPLTLLDGTRLELSLPASLGFDAQTLELAAQIGASGLPGARLDVTLCPGCGDDDFTGYVGDWTVRYSGDGLEFGDYLAYQPLTQWGVNPEGIYLLDEPALTIGPVDSPDATLGSEEGTVRVFQRNCGSAPPVAATDAQLTALDVDVPGTIALCHTDHQLEVWISDLEMTPDEIDAVSIEPLLAVAE